MSRGGFIALTPLVEIYDCGGRLCGTKERKLFGAAASCRHRRLTAITGRRAGRDRPVGEHGMPPKVGLIGLRRRCSVCSWRASSLCSSWLMPAFRSFEWIDLGKRSRLSRVAVGVTKEIHQCLKRHPHLSAAGVIDIKGVKRRAGVIGKYRNEFAGVKC